MFGSRIASTARNFSTSMIRRSGLMGGTPGENLPFSIENRHKFTALFFAFAISGFSIPFLIVRHQMLKK